MNFEGAAFVRELCPEDFEEAKPGQLKSKSCAIVLFYVPWCPHCQKMEDVWKQLGKMVEFRKIMVFDCEKYGRYVEKLKIAMPGLVPSYPSFVYYDKGVPIRAHRGDRTVDAFIQELLETCGKKEVEGYPR